jgi:hypothetical protein
MVQVQQQAADLVRRGAFSALRFNGVLSEHVAAAYMVWEGDDRRCGPDSMERDEFRMSVQREIERLGFAW